MSKLGYRSANEVLSAPQSVYDFQSDPEKPSPTGQESVRDALPVLLLATSQIQLF